MANGRVFTDDQEPCNFVFAERFNAYMKLLLPLWHPNSPLGFHWAAEPPSAPWRTTSEEEAPLGSGGGKSVLQQGVLGRFRTLDSSAFQVEKLGFFHSLNLMQSKQYIRGEPRKEQDSWGGLLSVVRGCGCSTKTF